MEIILGKTAGFCYGVREAVNGAIKQIENNEKIYCLGEIVHNEQVLEKLEKKGIKFVEDINSITDNSKVIIRAHGIPKETYEIAKTKKINIIDYTCPKVLKIHQIVEKYQEKGYYIILCGSKTHPENIGTISYCQKDNYIVIENMEDIMSNIDTINNCQNKKVLLIAQTTYNFEKFLEIKKCIKNNLSENIELKVKNTICQATELRQSETKVLSENVDYMIIIGGKKSSNTKKLYDIALEKCKNAKCIETAKELEFNDIDKAKKIGIMAGASTPQESIDDVIKKIKNKTCL